MCSTSYKWIRKFKIFFFRKFLQLQQQNRSINLQQQINPTLAGHPNQSIQQQNQYHQNNSTSMEPCKHAAVNSSNDRAPIKATTATN